MIGRRYGVAGPQSRLRAMRIPGCGLPRKDGCLTAAVVLGSCSGNPESLLSGATPDPPEPVRDPDAVARLQLTQALQRARYAIAWERGWPHLARLLTVVGLFLVVSWAGLWLALPFVARAIGLGLFVLLALAALFPLVRFRWPSREEGLSRLDRGTGIRHRPATALADTLVYAGSGRTGAVAGPARAHAGIDQADPRRPAVAAACDPRSLGAARAGRGADGGGLCRGGRRAHDAHRGGVRLERRAVAGQYQGRRLGDAAALYRQAADHPVGGEQGSRRAASRARCRFRWAAR